LNEEGKNIVSAKRARLYDAFALLIVMISVSLDQWTKHLVVQKLTVEKVVPFPFLGHYLVFEYTQNSGAAFSMLRGNDLLAVFILIAVGVVCYFYSRIYNSGPLSYKLVFGLIIGGALGNLLDRVIHGGYVIDFISFRIPEIKFYFAIFNIADASISLGVLLLFILAVLGSMDHKNADSKSNNEVQESVIEQDVDPSQESVIEQEPASIVNQKETS
jgi:signal peptidase II